MLSPDQQQQNKSRLLEETADFSPGKSALK
jgi:hypothetical protein